MSRKWTRATLAALLCLAAGCAAPTAQAPGALPTSMPTLSAVLSGTSTAVPEVTLTRPVQTGTDAATFLNENYPDYSVFAPGEKFVKTWEVKNVGTSTWNTSYFLALDSSPQNEALGSPALVPFPQDTPPGGSAPLSVPLTAPTTPGTYAVYWSLKNDHNGTFGVDGGRVWVIITVCAAGEACSPPVSGAGSSAGGVTATLTNFSSAASSATATFCMTLPNRNYGPAGGSVSLNVDQETVWAASGGSLNSGCFEFEFPLDASAIDQAQHVAVSIEQVRMLGGLNDPDGACQSARTTLMAKYPGLDFQCHFSMAGYITNLQLPSGMTSTQAQQIITDAVEGAIYGPWVLKIK